MNKLEGEKILDVTNGSDLGHLTDACEIHILTLME